MGCTSLVCGTHLPLVLALNPFSPVPPLPSAFSCFPSLMLSVQSPGVSNCQCLLVPAWWIMTNLTADPAKVTPVGSISCPLRSTAAGLWLVSKVPTSSGISIQLVTSVISLESICCMVVPGRVTYYTLCQGVCHVPTTSCPHLLEHGK